MSGGEQSSKTASAGLSGWLADRFYEAGADDVVSLIGNQPIPTPEAAQWTALAVIVGLYTGLALYTPSGFGQIGVINLPGMGKSGNPVMGKDRVELAKKREKVLKQIQQVVLHKISTRSCEDQGLWQLPTFGFVAVASIKQCKDIMVLVRCMQYAVHCCC